MLRLLMINGVRTVLAVAAIALLPLANLNCAEKARKAEADRSGNTFATPDDGGSRDDTSTSRTSKTNEKAKSDDSSVADDESNDSDKPIRKTDREWRRLLSTKEYRVTRQKETEQPFSGKYVHTKKDGVYRCVCCGAKLFGSETKFDSGTGWPSFYAPLRDKAIAKAPDFTDGSLRAEVMCSRCDAHLGHVFGDGPEPTGLRYCVNSTALKLEEKAKAGQKASRAK